MELSEFKSCVLPSMSDELQSAAECGASYLTDTDETLRWYKLDELTVTVNNDHIIVTSPEGYSAEDECSLHEWVEIIREEV